MFDYQRSVMPGFEKLTVVPTLLLLEDLFLNLGVRFYPGSTNFLSKARLVVHNWSPILDQRYIFIQAMAIEEHLWETMDQLSKVSDTLEITTSADVFHSELWVELYSTCMKMALWYLFAMIHSWHTKEETSQVLRYIMMLTVIGMVEYRTTFSV